MLTTYRIFVLRFIWLRVAVFIYEQSLEHYHFSYLKNKKSWGITKVMIDSTDKISDD